MLENCLARGVVSLEERIHAQDLVWWCLQSDPEQRPTIEQVLQ